MPRSRVWNWVETMVVLFSMLATIRFLQPRLGTALSVGVLLVVLTLYKVGAVYLWKRPWSDVWRWVENAVFVLLLPHGERLLAPYLGSGVSFVVLLGLYMVYLTYMDRRRAARAERGAGVSG